MTNPWDSIITPTELVSGKRVDCNHSLNLFWAKNTSGNCLFVVELRCHPLLKVEFPDLEGIKVYSYANGDVLNIVLSLNNSSDLELFLLLCDDLIKTTNGISDIHAWPVIKRRLNKWQEFLHLGSKDIMSEEEIKGLIGELIFLQQHAFPSFGVSAALRSWSGPLGASQDFLFSRSAVEVKCQSGSSFSYISISSLDQLVSPMPYLYIFVLTIVNAKDTTGDGVSLPKLVESIQTHIITNGKFGDLEHFADLLLNVGYRKNEEYETFVYEIMGLRMFEVKDGFPRILPTSVPAAISKVTYRIDLNQCEVYQVEVDRWKETSI